MTYRLLALSALLAAQLCQAAPVYKVVGPDGKVSFTDQPPASASAQALKVPVNQANVADQDRDPLLASMVVYGKQLTVEKGVRFCTTFAPRTAHAVVAARDLWKIRTAQLHDKKNKIVASRITSPNLQKMVENVENDTDAYLERMRSVPLAEKVQWCDRLPASMTSPELDATRNPTLVRTIMDYQFP
jgi:hypothetical protein